MEEFEEELEDEAEVLYEEIQTKEEDLDPHSRKFKPGGHLMMCVFVCLSVLREGFRTVLPKTIVA